MQRANAKNILVSLNFSESQVDNIYTRLYKMYGSEIDSFGLNEMKVAIYRFMDLDLKMPTFKFSAPFVYVFGDRGSGVTSTTIKLAHSLLNEKSRVAVSSMKDEKRVIEECDKYKIPYVRSDDLQSLAYDHIFIDTCFDISELDVSDMEGSREFVYVTETGSMVSMEDLYSLQPVVQSSIFVVLTKYETMPGSGHIYNMYKLGWMNFYAYTSGERAEMLNTLSKHKLIHAILGINNSPEEQENYMRKVHDRTDPNTLTLDKFLEILKNFNADSKQLEAFTGGQVGSISAEQAKKQKDDIYKALKSVVESMTPAEVADPFHMSANRVQALARGSGTTVELIKNILDMYRTVKSTFEGVRKKSL